VEILWNLFQETLSKDKKMIKEILCLKKLQSTWQTIESDVTSAKRTFAQNVMPNLIIPEKLVIKIMLPVADSVKKT